MATSPKVPKLTYKQAKFVKAKAEGKTNIDAALIAYDTTSRMTADAIATQTLRKTTVQEALHIALEKHGLTANRIVGVVSDGMAATKVTITRDAAGGEESAFAEETPDHSIRLKAAGMAAQFMGIGKNSIEGGVHFHNHVEEKKSGYEF